MTRDVRFPIASPGPNEPLVNPDGTAKDALREVIETVVNQAGGQGGDAVYDTQLLAILADQNAQQAGCASLRLLILPHGLSES
jgi:hypothetical protein